MIRQDRTEPIVDLPTVPRIEVRGRRPVDIPLAVIAGMLALGLLFAFATSAPRGPAPGTAGPTPSVGQTSAPAIQPAPAPGKGKGRDKGGG